jgi:hypothetical protein
MKRCCRCLVTKPNGAFYSQAGKRQNCQSWCKECAKTNNKRCSLARRYGMSVGDYDALLAEQCGGCAICGTTIPGGSSSRLCVDHDHLTGRIRGLLCVKCNSGIGLLGDDPARVRLAAAYLERHGATPGPQPNPPETDP